MAVSALALVVALYAAVGTAYAEARRRREPPPRWAKWLGLLAVVVHFAGLSALSAKYGRSPFATSAEALSFLAFSVAAIYCLLEATSRVESHGGSFYMIAALLAAVGVPGLVEALHADAAPATRDNVRTWHVGLGLLSAAAVLVGGLLAAGYLGSYFRVKRHRLAQGRQGMALSSLSRLTRNASFVSVLLLGASVALGLDLAGRGDAPGGVIVLNATMAVALLLLLGAWLIWWRRPVRGALAAWLNVGCVGLLLVVLVIVHPLVTGGG